MHRFRGRYRKSASIFQVVHQHRCVKFVKGSYRKLVLFYDFSIPVAGPSSKFSIFRRPATLFNFRMFQTTSETNIAKTFQKLPLTKVDFMQKHIRNKSVVYSILYTFMRKKLRDGEREKVRQLQA